MALEQTLQTEAQNLTEISRLAAQLKSQSNKSISQEVLKFFEECSGFSTELRNSVELLNIRRQVETILGLMLSNSMAPSPTTSPDNVFWGGVEMPFFHARLIGLQAYVSNTWSAYDTISKIAGRLSCIDSTSKNDNKMPKLVEDFIRGGRKSIGGRIVDALERLYGWPICFGYSARNWLVHEGNSKDGVMLFDGNTIQSGFSINQNALQILVDDCKGKNSVSESYTRKNETWPWENGDLFKILKCCFLETDEAIGILLKWSVAAVSNQLKLLGERDLP